MITSPSYAPLSSDLVSNLQVSLINSSPAKHKLRDLALVERASTDSTKRGMQKRGLNAKPTANLELGKRRKSLLRMPQRQALLPTMI